MSLITCQFCGAQYEDTERVCPYCGAENVPVSVREQQEYLLGIEQKKRRLNYEVPQEKSNRAVRKVTKGGLVVAALFAIFAVLAAGYSVVRTRQKRIQQQQALVQLEEYYAENDYAGMMEYMYSHDDVYSATYDKYDKLSNIYYYYSTAKEYLDEDLEQIRRYPEYKEDWTDTLSYDLAYLFRALSLLDELEENGYVYNEEAGASYLEDLVLYELKNTCLLSDAEIHEGRMRYDGYDTEYLDLAEIVLGRVF